MKMRIRALNTNPLKELLPRTSAKSVVMVAVICRRPVICSISWKASQSSAYGTGFPSDSELVTFFDTTARAAALAAAFSASAPAAAGSVADEEEAGFALGFGENRVPADGFFATSPDFGSGFARLAEGAAAASGAASVAGVGFEPSALVAGGAGLSRSNSPPSESESSITLRALLFFFSADSDAKIGADFSLPEASSVAAFDWPSAEDPESRGRFTLGAGLAPPPKNDLKR